MEVRTFMTKKSKVVRTALDRIQSRFACLNALEMRLQLVVYYIVLSYDVTVSQ